MLLRAKARQRYGLLDTVRGVAVVSMVLYHGVWDLVNLWGWDWTWFSSSWTRLWQQSILYTFVFLSGFCWKLGSRPLRRGLVVLGAGAAVSLVTFFMDPQARIVFGVLSMLGVCMLLLIPLERWLERLSAGWGAAVCIVLFLLTRPMSQGYLGIGKWAVVSLPSWLYRSTLTACLGFPPEWFASADYVPLIPWGFLFLTGYYIGRKVLSQPGDLLIFQWKPLALVGKHSLGVYLLHQPALYLMLTLLLY